LSARDGGRLTGRAQHDITHHSAPA
jgi:hypothetical protein